MTPRRAPDTPAEQAHRDAARAEKLAALQARLAEQVAALRSGQNWKDWLAVAARFHRYSFGNTLLIASQRPDATRVAGYRAWQALGRQVRKGERGIQVLAPVLRRPDTGEAGEQGRHAASATYDAADTLTPGPGRRVAGYRVAYVWDIGQTDGDPLPEPPPGPQLLTGHAADGLWDGLTAQVSAAGYRLERGDCGVADGWTSFPDRVVRIGGTAMDAQAVTTLAHELGHVLLHDPAALAATTTACCTGVVEVEAESVAYLVCTSRGMDTEASTFPYVTGWATSTDRDTPERVVAAAGQRALTAAGGILDRLDGAAPADERAAELRDRSTAAVTTTAALRARAEHAATRTAASGGEAELGLDPQLERRLLALHTLAVEHYRDQLHSPAGAGPRGYLTQRGLAHVLDPASQWQVGYAPAAWTSLTTHLRAAGYTDDELLASGLGMRTKKATVVDRFRDRIMLPVRDSAGRVVGFVGRAPHTASPDVPKYLNTPAGPLYRKSELLYGLAEHPPAGTRLVLVEGPLDVLAVARAAPVLAAVAPCGTSLTAAQTAHLAGSGARDLVIAFDADPAGQQAAARAHDLLRLHAMPAYAAVLPDGTDPAELSRTRPAELATLLCDNARLVPLVDVAVDAHLAGWDTHPHRDEIETRVTAARDTGRYLATLDPGDVAHQVARVARHLDVDPSTVTAGVIDALERGALAPAAAAAARVPQAGLDTPPHRRQPAAAAPSAAPRTEHAAGGSFPQKQPSPRRHPRRATSTGTATRGSAVSIAAPSQR